jgi:hypothetical protein
MGIKEEIIETQQLSAGKSTFLVDLVKYGSGKFYVSILQIVHGEPPMRQQIKIHPSSIKDVIRVLLHFQGKIPAPLILGRNFLKEEDEQKIQERYLKGVPIKDLALQFNRPKETIETVLRNRGIAVIPDSKPTKMYKSNWRKYL